MKKIEELIEKKISREEARKLLTEEEFEEFEKLLEMKSVLSEMYLGPPQDMQKRILEKIATEKRKSVFFGRRFKFVFTVVLVAVFTGFVIARGFIPSLSPFAPEGVQNGTVSPSPNSFSNKKGVSSESKKGLRMFSPTTSDYSVKVIVNSEDAREKVFSVLKNYCGESSSNGIYEIDNGKFDKFIKELEKYGKVDYRKNKSASEKKKITIKVEVVLK